ncbi:DUF155 domain-containing protein [[Candida] zeylanoides]
MSPPRSRSHSPNPEHVYQRSTAKRSPSILVTDARNDSIKGVRAPFAGQSLRKQQQQTNGLTQLQQSRQQQAQHQQQQQQQQQQYLLHKKLSTRANKYTDISVDKLLSNSSDIPSGQSRLPPLLARQSGRGPGSRHGTPPSSGGSGAPSLSANPLRRNMRSIPKLSQSLPSRTSKTSHKLVLIPEQQQQQQQQHHHHQHMAYRSPSPPAVPAPLGSGSAQLQAQMQRSRAELMPKEAREHEFNRMTAYFICEQFDLTAVTEFLRTCHEVKPRLYDEVLYVPYSLPLLPGHDGFRVKSNNSAKLLPKKKFIENMITKSEQTDHLYEYYSGVETPEDANNYSMDPENENFDYSAPFDPSEPQFFAPPQNDDDPKAEDTSDEADSATLRSQPKGDPPEAVSSPQAGSGPASAGSSSDPPSPASNSSQQSPPSTELSKHHAEMFVFAYGIVVFWNFSEIHEKNILADLAFASDEPHPLLINPIHEQDIETEEFHFEYDNNIHRPRIYNDMITLRSGDHLIKLTMSHAIAQSTKLCLFESRMVNILSSISKLPKKLALTGRLGLKRQQLLKKSGKLFKLRVDVNLSSSILDTPDFFWSLEPALHPLYTAVREYLEIEQRVQVLNDRCKVFLEFSDIVSDSMNEKNTNRITWMIILIVFISLGVSCFEFVLDIL